MTLFFSLLLDRIFGEPSRFHPLVGFGHLANKIEAILNTKNHKKLNGLLAWSLVVLPITLLVYFLDNWLGGIYLGVIFGWLAIGWQSLREHGLAVYDAFNHNDLDKARLKTSYLVSRDTSALDEEALSRATVESLLENGSDAIFAPIFWLLVLGAPGVVLYRLSNTLDAMWGYRNERFEQFGKVSARIDDVLNFIPARITALLYTLCGNSKQALKAWRNQAASWYSPNAGVVMASGAGALDLSLGGTAVYHGKAKQRPKLGYAKQPTQPADIQDAIRLLDRCVYTVMGFSALLVLFRLLNFA